MFDRSWNFSWPASADIAKTRASSTDGAQKDHCGCAGCVEPGPRGTCLVGSGSQLLSKTFLARRASIWGLISFWIAKATGGELPRWRFQSKPRRPSWSQPVSAKTPSAGEPASADLRLIHGWYHDAIRARRANHFLAIDDHAQGAACSM
jgi:hypothetical protein